MKKFFRAVCLSLLDSPRRELPICVTVTIPMTRAEAATWKCCQPWRREGVSGLTSAGPPGRSTTLGPSCPERASKYFATVWPEGKSRDRDEKNS